MLLNEGFFTHAFETRESCNLQIVNLDLSRPATASGTPLALDFKLHELIIYGASIRRKHSFA